MSAFLGYGEIGVWTSNGERDDFLDWFAAHRCEAHDPRWEYCKSELFMGACIELNDLIPKGERFEVSEQELADAGDLAGLLRVISLITRAEWHHKGSSTQAVSWSAPSLEQIEGVWKEPESASEILRRCHAARKKSIGLLSDWEFATLLDHGIGVDRILDEAVRRLAANQPDGTEDFGGQLREAVQRINEASDLALSCQCQALELQAQGRPAGALIFARRALAAWQKMRGDANPYTIEARQLVEFLEKTR